MKPKAPLSRGAFFGARASFGAGPLAPSFLGNLLPRGGKVRRKIFIRGLHFQAVSGQLLQER